MGVAAQGAGKGIWPFLAATARLIVAAAIGWVAVSKFDVGIGGLAVIVAASFVASTLVTTMAMFKKSLWTTAT